MKFFNLHEYEAKVLLKRNGLTVEECYLVKTTQEALYYAERLKNNAVIKCQVEAGGRGKGRLTSGLQGGVQICKSAEDVKRYSKQMLGHNLITIQTPKEGLLVKSLLIAEIIEVKKLFYLAMLLDRKSQAPILLASNEGGVDIEEVARTKPDAIFKQPIDVRKGLTNENISNVVNKLNFTDGERTQAVDQLKKLYELFIKFDATQIEINPWAVDSKGIVISI
jgi:succinyl-CoA synthetase beta subunit